MVNKEGKFRFTYFTDQYQETYEFYQKTLGFVLEHDWDRSDHDKGALFHAGLGLIEILHLPQEEHRIIGLDYRSPQGVFMCIQVWNIDELFKKYKSLAVPFQQEIVDQTWGHRSFSIVEPNGLVLFFFQEQF
ncbi:MAG: VOC family protein [Bacteroidota bacterium]